MKSYDEIAERNKHIKRRYDVHKSVRKTSDEFNIEKSQVHRILKDMECRDES